MFGREKMSGPVPAPSSVRSFETYSRSGPGYSITSIVCPVASSSCGTTAVSASIRACRCSAMRTVSAVATLAASAANAVPISNLLMIIVFLLR